MRHPLSVFHKGRKPLGGT